MQLQVANQVVAAAASISIVMQMNKNAALRYDKDETSQAKKNLSCTG